MRRAVASLMSNNVSFSEELQFCWTAVDGTCNRELPAHFGNGSALSLVVLSVVIGLLGGTVGSCMFWRRFVPAQKALTMTQYITEYPGSINQLSDTVRYSQYFCVAKHHAQVDLDTGVLQKSKTNTPEVGGRSKKTDRLWTRPEEETLNSEVLGVDYVWRTGVSGAYFEKATVKDMVSRTLIKKLRWINSLKLCEDFIPGDVYDEWVKKKMLPQEKDDDASDEYDEIRAFVSPEIWRTSYDEVQAYGKNNTTNKLPPYVKIFPSWMKAAPKFRGVRYGLDNAALTMLAAGWSVNGEQDPGNDISIPNTHGVIRDIAGHGAYGAKAPGFLKALHMTGQARVYFVKPIAGNSDEAKSDGDADVEIKEVPVLQHGTAVDPEIWKEELDSGWLKVFVDKDGVRRCDMKSTFGAYQDQIRATIYLLEQLRMSFSMWFMLEYPCDSISPPPITDPVVAKMLRAHPFLGIARDLYFETVHDEMGEVNLIAAHAGYILLTPFVIFATANVVYMIRLWEYGPRDRDEGGPIQVKRLTCMHFYRCSHSSRASSQPHFRTLIIVNSYKLAAPSRFCCHGK